MTTKDKGADTPPPIRLLDWTVSEILQSEAFRRARWMGALDGFRETANPVFAFSALANWPQDEPFTPEIVDWLHHVSAAVEEVALQVVGPGHLPVDDANAAILRALGLIQGKGKGSNALAKMRDAAVARTAAAYHHELRLANPDLPVKEIIFQLARHLHVSQPQARRYVRQGIKLIGKLPAPKE